MTAISTKGTRILLTKGGASGTDLVPTAISSAAPAEVTVADTTGIAEGDMVVLSDTGFPELDGKIFRVANLTATTFDLQGSDTSASTATLAGTPKAVVYTSSDVVNLCLASLTVNNSTPGTVSVATFCDPSASLPSSTQEAGTIDVTGFIDETAQDYLEMLAATSDGAMRYLAIVIPNGHGALVAPVSFSQMGFDVPIEGAFGWGATGVLGSSFKHIY